MFGAHHKVDNIISTIDYNQKQIDGPTDNVISLGNVKAKWEAFGWHVFEMDGNSMVEVLSTLKEAKAAAGKGKPVMIVMTTIMGKGVDFMEDDHNWHGFAPNDEQAKIALEQLEETWGDYAA